MRNREREEKVGDRLMAEENKIRKKWVGLHFRSNNKIFFFNFT